MNYFLIALFTLVFLGIVLFIWFSILIFMFYKDTAKNQQLVIVLGCNAKNEKPSEMLAKRLDIAAEYLLKYEHCHCIVSGGTDKGETVSEAFVMKEYLEKKGIDGFRITLEDKSVNTSENMKFSAEIIEDKGFPKDVAVVTSRFHQFRSHYFAKKFALSPTALSSDTPFPDCVVFHIRETMAIFKAFIFRY